MKSIPGLINQFKAAPADIQKSFEHLPGLLQDYPLDAAISYMFSQLEKAQ